MTIANREITGGFRPWETDFTGSCYQLRAYTYSLDEDGWGREEAEGSDIGLPFHSMEACEEYAESLSNQQIKEMTYFDRGCDYLEVCVEICDYENGEWCSSDEAGHYGTTYPVVWRGDKPVVQWSRGV